MANETTIVVKAKDESGPGVKSAETRISGLKKTIQNIAKTAGDVGAEAGRNIAKGIEKAGPALAKTAGAVGAAGAGLFAKGFADNMEIGAANDKLAAQLGVGSADAQKLGKLSGDLYANNFGESIGQVNEAIRGVSQNLAGMVDDSEMEAVTGDVLNLASAFDVDLNGATAAAGQLMKTGLADNAEQAMDIITSGFQKGVDKSGDFLDTLNEYGTKFRDLGLNGVEATGLMSQGLQAGARDADTVADALKELAIRSIDGSKTTADGFKSIGLNGDKMSQAFAKGGTAAHDALGQTLDALRAVQDPAKRDAAAVELFGTKAEDLGDSLYSLDLNSAAEGMGNVEGAAKRMGDTLADNGAAKVETMKRGFEQWTQQMASAQGPMGSVSAAVVAFAGPALAMAGQLGSLATGLAAVNAGSIASAASTVKDTAVKVINTTATYAASAASKAWAAGQWLLNAALSANPIGIVIIAIIALVAAIVYAYRHSEKFRAIVQVALRAVGAAWDWLKSKVSAAVEWIKIKSLQLLAAFLNFPGRMRAGFSKVFTYLIEPFANGISWVRAQLDKLMGYIAGIPGRIKSSVSGAVSGLGSFLPGFAHGGIVGHAAEGGARGGLVKVGEHGEELVRLPYGSQVIPNGKTQDMLSSAGSGGRTVLEIRSDGSKLADLLLEVLRKAIRVRGGNVQLVLGRS